jgi:DNA-binding Lrp family transcriptional regulator
VALVLLFLNLFGDSGRRKNPGGTRQSSAARQGESAVERAMRSAEARADRAVDKTDQALRRAAAQVERTIDRTARQVEQARRGAQPVPKPAKKAKPAKAKPAGVLLRILGAVFLFAGGTITLDFIASTFQGYYAELDELFAGLGFLVSGGAMFFRGHYLNKMNRRSQRYILAIGNVDAMPIDEIAKRVNRTPAKAAKELQKLIDKGYLGEDAYIDHEKGYFLRFGATLEEEPEPPVRETVPEPRETQEGYSGVLRSIRHANDRIADPVLSRKIDRLEQISGLIFKEVEEHPEKRNSIRTFFDYYLPTTQKLLDTYADFEETGVEGEHLRQAKERIEQTMDMIVDGFEHQLDQLYSSDAMDVVSDIQVMEAMLNRDTASAAKDFGYDPPPRVRPKADGDTEEDNGGITLQL